MVLNLRVRLCPEACPSLHRGGSAALYGAVAVTGGVVVYMRLVRGWTLGDMLYVTRAGLKKSISQVTDGESPKSGFRAYGAKLRF